MSTEQLESHDVIVVGASLAGLSAALYIARQGFDVLVIGMDLGGQATLATEVENYPGIPRISGLSLVDKIRSQVERFGGQITYEEVTSVEKLDSGFKVKTNMFSYHAKALVFAIGKSPRKLKVKGEEEFKGRGVSYCTVCDAPFFKDKIVAIVGVGDEANESAIYLSKLVKKAYYILPTEKVVGQSNIVSQVKDNEKVVLLLNSEVKEIRGKDRVNSIVVYDKNKKELRELEAEAIFIEMGYELRTSFLSNLVKLNEKGEIVVDKLARTSCEGIFAAGDVTDIPYKQMIIAAGFGAIAGLSACNYLLALKGKGIILSDWKKL
ncbi:MAG: NAD(P)/FAD-dependent oxidoreductase [Thermoproteota archaeon]|jgi:thioredoxin reductase (NADPH)